MIQYEDPCAPAWLLLVVIQASFHCFMLCSLQCRTFCLSLIYLPLSLFKYVVLASPLLCDNYFSIAIYLFPLMAMDMVPSSSLDQKELFSML